MFGTLLLITLAYLVGRAAGKSYERKKHQQQKQEVVTQLTEKMIAEKEPRKKDLNKNVIDIMLEFLARTSLFDDFKLIEVKYGVAKYQYLENDFLFTVIRDNDDEVQLVISKNKNILMHYKFDTYHSEFDKQEMNRSLIGEHPISEANNVILRFMRYVAHDSVWETFPDDFVYVDDVKKLTPIYTEEDIQKKKQETKEQVQAENAEELSILDNVHRLQKIVLSSHDSLDPKLVSTFHSILRNMQECLLHIDRLDAERKHSIEHSLQKDLENMITSYMDLNEINKVEKLPETMAALRIIDTGVKDILELFEKQNIRELEQHVRVVNERDY